MTASETEAHQSPSDNLNHVHQAVGRAREEIARVIVGQREAIDLALIAILTGHHALVEGVPGVAKTLLVRTLARVLGCEFGRIQFTPDMMPTDITGMNVFDTAAGKFSLVRGPVFTEFLLADEINRAPAKTKAGLLQAMQERCVSIDSGLHQLSPHFTVFATQNPIDHEGTYPLPEAQKDRFLLKIIMPPPSAEEERQLAMRTLGPDSPEKVLQNGAVSAVLPPAGLAKLQGQLGAILIRDELVKYSVDIVRSCRNDDSVMVGAGPRATQGLVLAARARAAIDGRDFVTPDDIKGMTVPVLAHRTLLRPEYDLEGLDVRAVIERVLSEVSVPQ